MRSRDKVPARPIVVHVCHGCMREFGTYGELPRGWRRLGSVVYCRRCAKGPGNAP